MNQHGAVEKICKKYGLLLASASDYNAEIPFENQKAIANFRVHNNDVMSGYHFASMDWGAFSITEVFFGPRGMELRDRTDRIKPREIGSNMVKADGLKIIAPPKKLNMEGKKIKGHCLIDKDPIVLQPVNDGYLIVTAWGFEAKDPEIQNPRHN